MRRSAAPTVSSSRPRRSRRSGAKHRTTPPPPRSRCPRWARMGEDAEMREELARARERIDELEEQIRLAMVERDPNDEKSVIVEIQGGAGGDEAGLWAGDLYRMLTKYAERLGFQTEAMDVGDGKYTFE